MSKHSAVFSKSAVTIAVLVVVLASGLFVFKTRQAKLEDRPTIAEQTPTVVETQVTTIPTPTPIPGWKTYTNDLDGMTFQYPPDWYVWRVEDKKEGVYKKLEQGQFDRIYSVVNIYPDHKSYFNLIDNSQVVSISATGWERETLYEGSKLGLKEGDKPTSVISEDVQDVNGLSLSTLTYSSGSNIRKLGVFEHSDKSYDLHYDQRDETVINKLINSIHFVETRPDSSEPLINTAVGSYEGWTSFKSQMYGFSLNYPDNSDWNIEYSLNSDFVPTFNISVTDPKQVTTDKVSVCRMYIYQNNNQEYAQRYDFSSKEQYAQKSGTPLNELSIENITLNGRAAQKVTAYKRNSASESSSGQIRYKLVGPQNTFIIDCDSLNTSNSQEKFIQIILEKIIKSLYVAE